MTRYHLFSEDELAQAINTWARDAKEEADQQSEEAAQVAIDTGAFGTAAAPLLLESMAARRKAKLRNQHAIDAVAEVEEQANEGLNRITSGSNAVIETGEFLARINAYCDEPFRASLVPIPLFWDDRPCTLLSMSKDSDLPLFSQAARKAGIEKFTLRHTDTWAWLLPEGYSSVLVCFNMSRLETWKALFPQTIPDEKEPA